MNDNDDNEDDDDDVEMPILMPMEAPTRKSPLGLTNADRRRSPVSQPERSVGNTRSDAAPRLAVAHKRTRANKALNANYNMAKFPAAVVPPTVRLHPSLNAPYDVRAALAKRRDSPALAPVSSLLIEAATTTTSEQADYFACAAAKRFRSQFLQTTASCSTAKNVRIKPMATNICSSFIMLRTAEVRRESKTTTKNARR